MNHRHGWWSMTTQLSVSDDECWRMLNIMMLLMVRQAEKWNGIGIVVWHLYIINSWICQIMPRHSDLLGHTVTHTPRFASAVYACASWNRRRLPTGFTQRSLATKTLNLCTPKSYVWLLYNHVGWPASTHVYCLYSTSYLRLLQEGVNVHFCINMYG